MRLLDFIAAGLHSDGRRSVTRVSQPLPAGRWELLSSDGESAPIHCEFETGDPDGVMEALSSACPEVLEAADLKWFRLSGRDSASAVNIFNAGGDSYPLYRDHRADIRIEPGVLLEAVEAAGDYLTRVVDENGRFLYAYEPITALDWKGYSVARHIGTLHGMLEIHEAIGDADLMLAIRRGVGYMEKLITPSPLGEGAVTVAARRHSELGTDGLALLVLAGFKAATGDDGHDGLMEGLAIGIAARQRPDGSFAQRHELATGDPVDSQSDFPPGQAIFGLARYYGTTGDSRWLAVAERAADHRVARALASGEDMQSDHWLLYGLSELYPYLPKASYLDLVLRMADLVIDSQIVTGDQPDWIGGYDRPPTTATSGTRAEGLCAVQPIIESSGDAELATRSRRALEHTARFLLFNQYGPELAISSRDPSFALGGFRHSFDHSYIRIDFVMHGASALLCLNQALVRSGSQYSD